MVNFQSTGRGPSQKRKDNVKIADKVSQRLLNET